MRRITGCQGPRRGPGDALTNRCERASNPWTEALGVTNRGCTVTNDPFQAVRASMFLTGSEDPTIVRVVQQREGIPAPLIVAVATAFGLSSTFQAYWIDELSNEHL